MKATALMFVVLSSALCSVTHSRHSSRRYSQPSRRLASAHASPHHSRTATTVPAQTTAVLRSAVTRPTGPTTVAPKGHVSRKQGGSGASSGSSSGSSHSHSSHSSVGAPIPKAAPRNSKRGQPVHGQRPAVNNDVRMGPIVPQGIQHYPQQRPGQQPYCNQAPQNFAPMNQHGQSFNPNCPRGGCPYTPKSIYPREAINNFPSPLPPAHLPFLHGQNYAVPPMVANHVDYRTSILNQINEFLSMKFPGMNLRVTLTESPQEEAQENSAEEEESKEEPEQPTTMIPKMSIKETSEGDVMEIQFKEQQAPAPAPESVIVL